jgi:tetratricopeptide (TPR) repeat protein
MKYKSLLASLAFLPLFLSPVCAGAQERSGLYEEAVNLYQSGAYARARTIFSSLGDPMSEAYALLCAIKDKDPDYPVLYKNYFDANPENVLGNQIRFEYASDLFGKEEYPEADAMLSQVVETRLTASDRLNYDFRKGYCSYKAGRLDEALDYFLKVESAPKNSLTSPSRYHIAYIAYSRKQFATAEKWFKLIENDERFKDLAEYYLLECRFMDKDYDFIISKGPDMFEQAPAERKPRLARLISESYLVKGDKTNALAYFMLESDRENLTRADLFHAGSVMYAVQDYKGAISNFSKMESRIDSLGQIANYQLGYSYIRTGNKVAASDSFRDASQLGYDPRIQEDAWFNYAKLAFDLNSDMSVFGGYLQQYPETVRKEQIFNYLAIAALNAKDYSAAIDAYDNIEELNDEQRGNYMKANYLRAGQLAGGGAFSDAVRYFRAAAINLPKSDRFAQLARYWLGEAYFNSGDYASAAGVYEDLYNVSALDGRPEGRMMTYNLACSNYNLGKYEAAARWFDQYIASEDPTAQKDALLRRADCDFARHNYKAAVESYQKVLDAYANVNDIYPYYQQALAYGLSGKKKEKVNILSRVTMASADSPMYSEAMYELGRAYMEIDENEKAVRTFSTLQTSTSDNTFAARALIGRGMAYRNMKNYEMALSSYKGVVDMMPESEYAEEALMAINSVYQTTGEPEKFLEYVQNRNLSMGKTPAEKEVMYFNTAEQIYLSGSYEKAVSSFQKYLKDYPKGSRVGDAWFYLADSYKNLSEKERACSAFKQAATMLKEGSFAESAAYNYAKLSYDLQRFPDAYDGYCMLLDVAKMEENKAAARLGKMRSAYQAHSFEDAIAAARNLISSNPSAAEQREGWFIEAKSLLATSHRDEAYLFFKKLAEQASTPEGAESYYMIVRDLCDTGEFAKLEDKVYDFAAKCGEQTYWLAKCYIVLGDGFREQGKTAQARATWESIRDGYTPGFDGDDIIETVNQKIAAL